MFDIWKSALAEIEQAISGPNFETFFSNNACELVNIIDGVANISTRNVFCKSQLNNKYYELILNALKNNGATVTELNFIVQSNSQVKIASREISQEEIKSISQITKPRVKNIVENNMNDNGLKSEYTLDNFVIGSNNDLAVSIAKNVIDQPGVKYNPFFLYGGPGLGKTHLVQAIGNELLKKNPNLKILYIPTNHFYSDFISMIKNKRGDEFAAKFRKLDVLIIDDFQQMVGKDRSQEEFFNIFNDLHHLNKQIIITSDRLPNQIQDLDARLASRLTWGGAVDLQMPNFEDKCAILRSKAEFSGINIEEEAIEYIAENVKTNIRDLEGEFTRLIAYSDFKGRTPLEIINAGFMNTHVSSSVRAVTPKQIVEKVAKYYQLTVKEMCSKSRVANIKNARQVAMYFLSTELNMSTPSIATEVGVKDHTTVMHGIKKIKTDTKTNFELKSQIDQIKEKIYG